MRRQLQSPAALHSCRCRRQQRSGLQSMIAQCLVGSLERHVRDWTLRWCAVVFQL